VYFKVIVNIKCSWYLFRCCAFSFGYGDAALYRGCLQGIYHWFQYVWEECNKILGYIHFWVANIYYGV
jgi:hypothetical protein